MKHEEILKFFAQLSDEIEARKSSDYPSEAYEIRRHMANLFLRLMSEHQLERRKSP